MQKGEFIAITGSQGLIGQSLVKQLNKSAIPFICIDKRLGSKALGHGDICNKSWLAEVLAHCKGIVHLAAVSRVVWGEQEPSLCWQVNVDGTKNLLEISFESPHRPWVIYASSREVYGQQVTLPVTEQSILQPMNIYAKSKAAAEDLVNMYREKGLTTAILRFSSVYGDKNDYHDRVIPAFCLNAIRNQSLRIDGLQNLFDFTHVNDVASGIIKTIQLLEKTDTNIPTMHLTTGIGTTLIEVVKLIEEILDKKIHYHEAPRRTYDVYSFRGDPTCAMQCLNWQAQIDLKSGLTDLLNQYQNILAAEQMT